MCLWSTPYFPPFIAVLRIKRAFLGILAGCLRKSRGGGGFLKFLDLENMKLCSFAYYKWKLLVITFASLSLPQATL